METDKESSISGIMAEDLPLMSSGFTEREIISRHGAYVLVKARRLGKWFKLKALDERYASDGLYRELLRKEFEIGFSLDHPNICRTYDLVNDEQLGLCIVQEYVQGVRLDDWLPSASVKARRRAVGQILDAMSCFHAGGIVHRDLKPSNILVTDNGSNVKIIDFGLSDADRYAILKQPAGTVGFSAPQQMAEDSAGSSAASSGYTDVRNDIYSFGRILPLFRLGSVYSRIARKAASANPANRYADVEEIRSELHRADVSVYALGAFVLVCGFAVLAAFTMSYQRKFSRLNENVARFDDSLSTFNSRVREFEEAKAAFSQTYSEWQKDKERKLVFEEVGEMLKKDADAYYAPVIEHTKSLSPYDLEEDSRWSGSYFEKTPVLTFERNALDKYAEAYSLDGMAVRQLKVMLDEYCNQIAVEHSRLVRERWMELNDR